MEFVGKAVFEGRKSLEPLYYAAMMMVGQRVRVQVRDGRVFEGFFHTASPEDGFGCVLRQAFEVEGLEADWREAPTKRWVRRGAVENMLIMADDFVQIYARGVRVDLQAAAADDDDDEEEDEEGAFASDDPDTLSALIRDGASDHDGAVLKTDAEISKARAARRTLVRWSGDDDSEEGLDDAGRSSRDDDALAVGRGKWDQFEANQRLFGVRGKFDESIYTTTIDRKQPDYHLRKREADRLAAEILSGDTSDRAVLEERGVMLPDDGIDEEDRHSSVIRAQPQHQPAPKKRERKRKTKPSAAAAAAAAAASPPAQDPNVYTPPHKRGDAKMVEKPDTPQVLKPADVRAAPDAANVPQPRVLKLNPKAKEFVPTFTAPEPEPADDDGYYDDYDEGYEYEAYGAPAGYYGAAPYMPNMYAPPPSPPHLPPYMHPPPPHGAPPHSAPPHVQYHPHMPPPQYPPPPHGYPSPPYSN